MDPENTYRSVQERYGHLANRTGPESHGSYEHKIAAKFGYDPEDLRSIPEDANLGVSCGNPLATANIREVGCNLHWPLSMDSNSCRAKRWLI